MCEMLAAHALLIKGGGGGGGGGGGLGLSRVCVVKISC